MKAVMPDVPEHLLEWRRRTGADQWDEMWEGVLHMPPMPNIHHQDLGSNLVTYLANHWGRPRRAKVLYEVNLASIGGWPDDYRVPDITLLTRKRFHINKGEYLEGAADAVIEIHSPGDETYDKIPFYEKVGTPELWIIHRDTKKPEVYLLKRGKLRLQAIPSSGWVASPLTGLEMKATRQGKLAIREAGADATREELPLTD